MNRRSAHEVARRGRGTGIPLTTCLPLILVLLLMTSCGGKKEIKPLPPEAVEAKRVISLAERIREAYERKDREDLGKLCTDRGCLAFSAEGLERFDSARLDFRPKLVEIDGDQVLLHLQWEGRWVISGGKVLERGGLALFEFRGSPPRLYDIRRENPFLPPEF